MKEREAMLVAFGAHMGTGQQRKFSGQPYIFHPQRVVGLLKGFGVTDEFVLVAAWLHDVVEDTNVTLDHLGALGFEARVIRILEVLTKSATGDREAVKAAALQALRDGPVEAVIIKMADRMDNLMDWRIEALPRGYIEEARSILAIARSREHFSPEFGRAYARALKEFAAVIEQVAAEKEEAIRR